MIKVERIDSEVTERHNMMGHQYRYKSSIFREDKEADESDFARCDADPIPTATQSPHNTVKLGSDNIDITSALVNLDFPEVKPEKITIEEELQTKTMLEQPTSDVLIEIKNTNQSAEIENVRIDIQG